jgi:hypothetical protein
LPPPASGQPQYAVRHMAVGFVRVDAHCKSSAGEDEMPTSRRRSHTVGFCRIRYRGSRPGFPGGRSSRLAPAQELNPLKLWRPQRVGRRCVAQSLRPRRAAAAPFSHTHRPHFSQIHATRASRANFDFPQNSFVWEKKKLDSRPYNGRANVHAFRLNTPPDPSWPGEHGGRVSETTGRLWEALGSRSRVGCI